MQIRDIEEPHPAHGIVLGDTPVFLKTEEISPDDKAFFAHFNRGPGSIFVRVSLQSVRVSLEVAQLDPLNL
jgi:hypothetical protein